MWQRVYIEAEQIKYRNSNSALIIANVNDEEYTFWYPKKLIEFYGKECAELLVKDDFRITLKNSNKIGGEWKTTNEISIKGTKISEYLKPLDLIHKPKKLEPLKDVKPLEELQDD